MTWGQSRIGTVRCAIAVAAACCLVPGIAHADQATGSSQVGVIQPLSFIKTEDLDFGSIIAGTTTGTVTVAPSGLRTATGGVTLYGNSGYQAAEFAGWGRFNQRVGVSIGSNSIFVTGPGAPMRVRTFVIGSTPTAILSTNPRIFRIGGANGAFRFPVGATLEVGANQTPGTYTGSWTITLNYQ